MTTIDKILTDQEIGEMSDMDVLEYYKKEPGSSRGNIERVTPQTARKILLKRYNDNIEKTDKIRGIPETTMNSQQERRPLGPQSQKALDNYLKIKAQGTKEEQPKIYGSAGGKSGKYITTDPNDLEAREKALEEECSPAILKQLNKYFQRKIQEMKEEQTKKPDYKK